MQNDGTGTLLAGAANCAALAIIAASTPSRFQEHGSTTDPGRRPHSPAKCIAPRLGIKAGLVVYPFLDARAAVVPVAFGVVPEGRCRVARRRHRVSGAASPPARSSPSRYAAHSSISRRRRSNRSDLA